MEQEHNGLKGWISFVMGNLWLAFFAVLNPAAFSPYFVLIVAALLFGPSVIGLFKGGPKNE